MGSIIHCEVIRSDDICWVVCSVFIRSDVIRCVIIHSVSESILWTRNTGFSKYLIQHCFSIFGVSDYAAAVLANGPLKGCGHITDDNRIDVIDPSKISKEKRLIRTASLSEGKTEIIGLKCLTLDSKKDADSLFIDFSEGRSQFVLFQKP